MESLDLPEWERLLSAERHLQALVPGTVLVGGTAAAHAGQRRSLGGGHVLGDLRPRFDEVLATLEAVAGSQTTRVQRPVAILERLSDAAPSDADAIDLRTYKGLVAPWNDWGHLATRGRHWAGVLVAGLLGGNAP